ncbi:MAG: relaxase/mobilization nuclease domain-containing protein [Lachnospiraceae bacterium]|nr:relaxase/mobilization nuclease domain-containing protein [Muribaculaceae bacterium]MCM1412660.1 relaxase/mobilization nuclease domain-containing protein [Lachnospiraceae bacterium]
MATTRIISLHGRKGQSTVQTLLGRIDYAENPEKTDNGRLVSSYECLPETAADEFAVSKYLYTASTGKEQAPEKDVLAYMIRQSFKPGEVTPEDANRIGYDLAMEFTKGKHQFIVATHTDKAHIHNHVIINSTTLDCDRKFSEPHQSGRVVAKISDRLCRENGLSVVENPKQKGLSYKEWDARRKGISWKGALQEAIDRVLPDSSNFDDFLARMRAEGYEIKVGKYLSFRAMGQERFTRSKTLGADYTLEALKERIDAKGRQTTVKENIPFPAGKKVNRLVDIEAKRQEGKGKGYEHIANFVRWAKLFNLKEAANTLNFLTEHGIADYDDLVLKAEKAGQDFDTASMRIKEVEKRLAELSALRSHIINYSKTRDIYVAYRSAKNKKAYLAAHKDEIALHESARQAFDQLGGKKIPKAAEIQAGFSSLLAEKKELYQVYRKARKDMVDLGTAKQNIERILNIRGQEYTQKNHRDAER